jgi:hypothetical protein
MDDWPGKPFLFLSLSGLELKYRACRDHRGRFASCGAGGAISQDVRHLPGRGVATGAMKVNPAKTNEEVRNFLEEHPGAKPVRIPLTGTLKDRLREKYEHWRKSEPDEVAKVHRLLKADEIPPPIVSFYGNGKIGVPDGWHRLIAYHLAGKPHILGYALDGQGKPLDRVDPGLLTGKT